MSDIDWDFRGNAKRIDDYDLPRIGEVIGVGEDELHAFMDAESQGKGFDELGRPKILFEPAVFYQELPKAKRAQAVKAGLAAPRWGQIPYGKTRDQYGKLARAMEIDQTAALKACSWGLFQVLGKNHKMVGYDTVQDMVRAMMEDEENHLRAAIEYLVAANLDDDLRAHRWDVVARGYNGPGYRVNRYDEKLRDAYKRWSRIQDTPYPVVSPEEPPEAIPEAPSVKVKKGKWPEDSLAPPEVKTVQRRLNELGFFPGKVDGDWGDATAGAILQFQRNNELEPDGHWGPATRAVLFSDKAKAKPISSVRANMTVDDLRKADSKIVTEADKVTTPAKAGTIVGTGTLVAGAVTEAFPDALSYVRQAREVFAELPWWVYMALAVLVCFYFASKGDKIKEWRLKDERAGRNIGITEPASNGVHPETVA
jgi:N-acetylmuramidase-like protein/putative peptidoglycan binding protein